MLGAFLVRISVADAGVLSFLHSSQKPQEEARGTARNSQNMTLLEAVQSPDQNGGRGGGDITIVDQSALLPDSGPLGTAADIEDGVPTSDQITIYTVHEGDTLAAIAKAFGVSTNTIIWANSLSGKSVSVGTHLIILPISGVQHTVKAGETIEKIAERYKANSKEVAVFNGISLGTKLAVGETIIIPDGEIEAAHPATPRTPSRRSYPRSVASYEGYYTRPINGGYKSQGLHGYNGVDLASFEGAPVYAAATGDVLVAHEGGWNGGYGNYIVISHGNGTQTLYGHLESVIAVEGWHVVRGQLIGYLGNTGRSTGPHVHFEVRGARNPF